MEERQAAAARTNLRFWRGPLIVLLLACCVYADSLVPNDVNFGIVYLFVLLAAHRLHQSNRAIAGFAALSSGCIIAGCFIAPAAADLAVVLSNRAVSLIMLWLAAWLLVDNQRKNQAIAIREQQLQAALREAHEQSEQRRKTQLSIFNILADLEHVNRQLREENSERHKIEAELVRYSRDLERSNQALQEFATIASHDLQEPLRKIHGFSTLILNEKNQLSEDTELYLGRIISAAKRMGELIQAMLEYSRITSHALPQVMVDLDQLLHEALDNLAYAIEQKGACIEAEPLGQIVADGVQFRQLFQNLIGNSIKYSRKNTVPTIRIFKEDADDGLLRFSIQDNGIGFEPRYAENIFKIFTRLHGKSEYEGNGIGLSICRKIVERHGGAIVAKGIPDEMAKFTITLPVKKNSE